MTTGWLYVGDDGIEWSDQHPVRSGQVPDARLIRRATNKELLSALKDAWEAHGEAVQSEARLRSQRDHECERANRFYRFCVSNPDVMKRYLADEEAETARAAS